MSKLEEVTEKICELLRNTEFEANMRGEVGSFSNPIREAEILMTLPIYEYAIDSSGEFLTECCREFGREESGIYWTLGKSLSEQPSETINFLYEILVS